MKKTVAALITSLGVATLSFDLDTGMMTGLYPDGTAELMYQCSTIDVARTRLLAMAGLYENSRTGYLEGMAILGDWPTAVTTPITEALLGLRIARAEDEADKLLAHRIYAWHIEHGARYADAEFKAHGSALERWKKSTAREVLAQALLLEQVVCG